MMKNAIYITFRFITIKKTLKIRKTLEIPYELGLYNKSRFFNNSAVQPPYQRGKLTENDLLNSIIIYYSIFGAQRILFDESITKF